MDIKVNGRTLSDRPLVLGVQGDNNVEELRFLIPRYTGSGVDLSQGIGYAVFRLPDGTDGYVSLTPEVLDTDENTVSLTLLVGSQMTEQKGSGKLCLKVAGLESAMWSSTICDMFVNGTIAMPSPQPVSLFRTMYVGPKLAEDESEPPLTVTERTINIPTELQTIAVAQDENSEAVKIMVPRYFDGQDLSVHDFILHTEMGSNGTDDILFNNQNGQMKSVEDSTVTLTWVLRPPQTSFEGKLNIQLLVQGDEFKWHSLIGELTIAKHITGDPVVPATPSMYEQWLAEVKEQADYVRSQASNIQAVIDEMDAIKDAPAAAGRAEKATEDAKKAAEDAKKAASESKGFRTFFSSVRPDANGNLDPSRPMTVGPAASVEIESAGDRIESVTAHGFTQQAGSGDPSPTNVRALTNGGVWLYETTFDGSEDENWEAFSGMPGTFFCDVHVKNEVGKKSYTNRLVLRYPFSPGIEILKENEFTLQPLPNGMRFVFRVDSSSTSTTACKAALRADPITLWIAPADESDATGLYAPIILSSGEYRATCLPLTAPLCEGDSVVSYIKSGCDKKIVIDGTQTPISVTALNSVYRIAFSFSTSAISTKTQYSDRFPAQESYDAENEHFYALNSLYVFVDKTKLSGGANENAKQYFSANPLTVWYRSTNYTDAADIPVSLETHQQAVLVLDGTEPDLMFTTSGAQTEPVLTFPTPNVKRSVAPKCSHYTPKNVSKPIPDNSLYFSDTYFGGRMAIRDSTWDSLEDAKVYLAAQYAAGTPVTIVYQLATPITYAHEAVVLEAATGDQLTYTVTGQSGGTVSVALKPMQDGGDADKLGGKLPEYYAAAANALGQYTHKKSGTVHTLTGSGDNIRFVAAADFAAGDTFQVNGTGCTARTVGGDTLWAGFFRAGAVVVCYRTGNALTFNGGGLPAAEAAKLAPENIKTGVSITANGKTVNGTFTADGTAAAGDMLAGKIGYVKGQKVTGSMPNHGAIWDKLSINGTVTIPAGYHNGQGEVTQSIPTKGAASYKPGTSAQTILSGQYLTGNQTIQGDANLKAANIRSGVSIFGVAGSFIEGSGGFLYMGQQGNTAMYGYAFGSASYSNGIRIGRAGKYRLVMYGYNETRATGYLRVNGSDVLSADLGTAALKQIDKQLNVGDVVTIAASSGNNYALTGFVYNI